jgi:glycosyltransferase involved in cell wall biosynthesis
MNKPLVSVIIPNYNYGRYLKETIDSVLAQTYPNIEIVVADDGSTDNSEEVLSNYGNRVKWFKQQNQGVSRARNQAVKQSNGEILAFLDSDDLWLPQKIEKQVQLFNDAEIGLVHCGFVDFDNKGNLLKEHLDGLSGWVATDLLLYQRPVVLGGGSAAIVKREAFDKVGGFDPNVSPAEDWEFYYQVARHYKIGFIEEVLMKYREHENNAHLNVKRMERALLTAYGKIFSADESDIKHLKRSCYSRIHMILAGSYYGAGQYSDFLRHAVKSLSYSPENITQLMGFPVRWTKRQMKSLNKSSAL